MAIHEHVVVQGECLSLIAMRHGQTWQELWAMAENAHLHELRGDPDVLYPGDLVYYGEAEEKEYGRGTEARHRFRVHGTPFKLELTIYNTRHRPKTNVPWCLEIEGKKTDVERTGPDGLIKKTLNPGIRSVTLHLGEFSLPLKLSHLDPANKTTGIQQRLGNLGYDVGPVDGLFGPRTAEAVRSYQEVELRRGLEATGEPDPDTLQNLRRLHEDVLLDGTPNIFDHEEEAPQDYRAGEEPEDEGEELFYDDAEDEERDGEEEESVVDEKAMGDDPARPLSTRALQEMLIALGYDPGPVDGIPGPLTEAAVRQFQADHGLVVDGIVGRNTRTAIREAYNNGV